MDEFGSGVLVLHKPRGMTSQQAVTRVRRMLDYAKAGHSGILDPEVTGVLPILFGSATRLAEYIMDAQKAYEAVVQFGSATDTQDATGQVVATGDPSGLDRAVVDAALATFVGEIEQMPPQYSALKIAGVRAYELARKGQVAPLVARTVQVLSCSLIDFTHVEGLVQARFSITCKKGTYVRTICHDLGALVGVPAHMAQLVRTRSGPFTLADAHSIDEVAEKGRLLVLTPEHAVTSLPAFTVTPEQAQRVFHGARLQVRGVAPLPVAQDVRLHGPSGQLLAIYTVLHAVPGEGLTLAAKKVLALQEVTV